MLEKLRKMYFVTTSSRENAYPPVSLSSIAPILTVLAGGVILAYIILTLERLHHNFWANKFGERCQLARKLIGTIRDKFWRESKEEKYCEEHASSEQSVAVGYCP